ncbi:MAG: Nramp family divalent metal transporter [Planctomycetota bacterium]
MTTRKRWIRFGPGWLVTAAFIGPGTVVTASKAGALFGCDLLWAILFACFGAIVLQSLVARVGISTQGGLGEAIRQSLARSIWLRPAIVLVIAAIGIGNTAYQTGNLTGAVTGISFIAGGDPAIWLVLLAAAACTLVCIGRYQWLHRILVALVIVLSLAFLSTASLSMPSLGRMMGGLFVPRVPDGSLSLVLGLIGTTIVPYNLFLHASGAARTWAGADPKEAILQSDRDTLLSVSLGGLVTIAICLTASAAFFDTQTRWESIGDSAKQLSPTLGPLSSVAFGIGLFAAGLTSSITAPVATAYAICGCLNWNATLESRAFRGIALAVILIGTAIAVSLGKSPASVILFAQVSNGLLLPIIAAFVLRVSIGQVRKESDEMSRSRLVVAAGVVAVVSSLGVWRLISALFPLG